MWIRLTNTHAQSKDPYALIRSRRSSASRVFPRRHAEDLGPETVVRDSAATTQPLQKL
jgi:hypothetical protein